MQTTLVTPYCYIPDKVSTVADHELPPLEQMTTLREVQQIDEVRSIVITPSQTFDVDSLFHLRQVSLHQEQRTFWHLIVTTAVCALAVLGILCFSLRSHPCTQLYTLLSLHKHAYRTQDCYFKSFARNSRTQAKNAFSKKRRTSTRCYIYGLSTETSRIIIIKIHAKMVARKSLVNESSTRLQSDVSTR
jgi:hypothetical protein